MCEASSSTPPREEWDFSEKNLPDKQVELCFRHEYRREYYLAQGTDDDSVTPFLAIPAERRTGINISSLHPQSKREIFLRAAPGSGDAFSENPHFASGAVVPGDVPAMGRFIDHAFSGERKGMVLRYLESGGNERAFFRQGIEPAGSDAGLVALLCLNTRDYGKQELIEGFTEFLEKFAGGMGSGRGPALSRYRKALKNLAILRICHSVSLHAAIRFFWVSYLADQFLDSGRHSYLEVTINAPTGKVRGENFKQVQERIRERRRQVLECFREENPEAAETDEPACYDQYSGYQHPGF